MSGSGERETDDVLKCERCHGAYAVEVAEDGSGPRVRCSSCGHTRAADAPASPEEAVEATPQRRVESPPESEPFLLAKARSLKPPVPPPPASEEEEAPLSLRDAISTEDADDDAQPLSLRDALPMSEPNVQTVSLRDVTLASNEPDVAAPARGVLRTLPPTTKGGGSSLPPPTITFDEPKSTKSVPPADKVPVIKMPASTPPPSTTTKPVSTTTKPKSALAQVAPEEPKRGWVIPALVGAGIVFVLWKLVGSGASTPATPTPTATSAAPKTITASTVVETQTAPSPSASASASASAAPEAPKPSVVAANATAASTNEGAPASRPASATPGQAPTAAASAETPPAEKNAGLGNLSMSELLDRAGSARRSGDLATARNLYEHILKDNPGNVEANGGLGDVARAQGDFAAAKASYESALAASPSYMPALLGLADTEWDSGNKDGARQRYTQVVERAGERAPARAKERSAATE